MKNRSLEVAFRLGIAIQVGSRAKRELRTAGYDCVEDWEQ